MIKFIRNIFRAPSAEEYQQRKLDDAKLQLAEFEISLDYDMAMCEMFRKRIARIEDEQKARHVN